MADDVYIYESRSNIPNPSFSDDGTGSDWLVLSGDYGGSLANPGATIVLSKALYDPAHPVAQDYAFAFPASNVWAPYYIYGTIENAMGGVGSELILGSLVDNILQGDPDDVAGGGDELWGYAGNDSLFGMGGSDRLYGGAGDDRLFGDAGLQGNIVQGDDSLYGGEGNDSFYGGQGSNRFDGGDGAIDTADYSGFFDDFGNLSYRVSVNLELGTATVTARDLFDGTEFVVATDTLSGIEAAIGTDGNDLLTSRSTVAFGDYKGGLLYGGAGADGLHGGTFADALYGGDGNDTLDDGGNTLPPGSAVDLMNGGNGDDHYTVSSASTLFYEAASGGYDSVFTQISLTLAGNFESLTLSSGFAAALNGTGNTLDNDLFGNELANSLTGLAGADSLHGSGGNDSLQGSSGNDHLYGDAGNDILIGGIGNDTLSGGTQGDLLTGGAGRDVMTGGGGADIFIFATSKDSGVGRLRDQITDFRSTVDHIDLHRIAPNQDFIATSGFTGLNLAEVRYDKTTGILAGDSDGNGSADWQIGLGAGTTLVAGDLIL